MQVQLSICVELRRFPIFCLGEQRENESRMGKFERFYLVGNWPKSNPGLIARGNETMWIEESVLAQVSRTGLSRRMRFHIYADAAIHILLQFKQVFCLPLQVIQGFAQSPRKPTFADLLAPNYLTLSRDVAESVQVGAMVPLRLAQGRREWGKRSRYHRRSLVPNLTPLSEPRTGLRLWALELGTPKRRSTRTYATA